jgi:hypothetical protein
MTPDEMAKKVAEAIANIGNPNVPRKMYQPPNLSEHDAIVQHQQAQAQRLK